MSFDKDINKIFEQLTSAVKSLEGERDLSEILTDNFISSNTSFSTYEEFIEHAPVTIREEIEEDEMEKLDDYVASNTNYSDWNEMYQAAGQEFAIEQLKGKGFDFR